MSALATALIGDLDYSTMTARLDARFRAGISADGLAATRTTSYD